jgi:hypothetical protein
MKKMNIVTRVKLHRAVSWWLVIFAVLTILSGYAAARDWVAYSSRMEFLHNIFEWTYLSLFLFHTIYTFFFVKIKTLRLLKKPGKHWIRLLQQLTKWLLIVLSVWITLVGFSYYNWIPTWYENFFKEGWHVYLWDYFLSVTIIIHTMCGAWVYFQRKQKAKWWSAVLIIVVGLALLTGVTYLEFFV